MPRKPALSISSTSWTSQTKTFCEQTKPRPKSTTLRKLKTSLFSLSKELLSDADSSDASHSSTMQSHGSKQKPHSRLARINTSFSSLSSTISSASTSRSSHCSTPSWSSSPASTEISHQSYPSPTTTNLLPRMSASNPARARSPSSVIHQFPFPLVTLEEAAETHELVLGKESYELYDSNVDDLEYGYGYETARSSSPILDSFGGSFRGGQKHLIHFERQPRSSEKASTFPHSSYFSCHSYPGCDEAYYSGLNSGFMDDLLPPLPTRVSEALEAAAVCKRQSEL